MLPSRTMTDVGVVVVPVSVLFSKLFFRSMVPSQETVSFLSKSLRTSSTSQVSLECPKRRKRRLNERAAFVIILRRRRRILSRIFSDSTSGPSKSLATRRNPPRGKRVILKTSAPRLYSGSVGQRKTHKKYEEQGRDVCNRKIFVIHAVERSGRHNAHRNGRR